MTQRDPPPTVFAHGTTVPDPVARAQEGPHGVGARTRKVDGFAKATGATQYTDDIQLPRMLHARIKRSTRAHARLVKVDTSAALAMPGVVAVLTDRKSVV